MRDPDKARERQRRYRNRKRVERFGPAAIGVDLRGRHGNHARGERSGHWNGGRYITSHGYACVAVPPGHHLRQAHGYAYEHDLVAEVKIGRQLGPNEVVHHLDGDKLNNRPENLIVETRSAHARRHATTPGARDDRGRFTPGRRCEGEWPEDLRVRVIPERAPIGATEGAPR